MPERTPEPGNSAATFKRFAPLALVVAVTALAIALGWHEYLSLDAIVQNRDALQAWVSSHWLLAVIAYTALYAVAVALSLPVGLLLTIAGGMLFGWWTGGVAAVIGATAGATAIFVIARNAAGDALARRAGPWLAKLKVGFNDNAFSYLLLLRLVPAFPFWLVNLAPALLGVPLETYVLGTLIGILPGTFAFASAGASIDSVLASAQARFQACRTAAAGPDCKLTIGFSDVFTFELGLAIALLCLVALIPVLARIRKR